MKKIDALIIGAGPAGTSCALALAHHGLNTTVVDKSVFPRPKVCGGFIGPQSKDLLSSLGVWQKLLERGAKPIDKSVLYSPGGASVTIPIEDRGALGCSRNLLDSVLVDRLKASGVRVMEGARVRQTFSSGNGFEVDIDHYRRNTQERFYTSHLIDAKGHSSPDFKQGKVQLGIAALYENRPYLKGQVPLFCCHQGHVGINPFEDNRVNVCYVVEEGHFQSHGCDPQKVLEGWIKEHLPLRKIMEGAKRLTPWKAVYVPVRDTIKLLDKGIWRTGDSAAFINPVTGGGMSVALLGGQLLAHAIVGHDNDNDRLKAYSSSYRKCFLGQRWLAAVWGELAHRPSSSTAVIKLLNSHHFFRSEIMQHSHPLFQMKPVLQY